MNHWTEREQATAEELLSQGLSYAEIGVILDRSTKSVKVKMQRVGKGVLQFREPAPLKICAECGGFIKNFGIKFCSQSCAATYNNKGVQRNFSDKIKIERLPRIPRKTLTCKNCGKPAKKKFCCQECANESKNKDRTNRILLDDGSLPERAYRTYLIRTYGAKCMDCGWDKINPKSGKCPIEMEHIDGDSTNNKLSNLKLLCPNCHALTPTAKGLNRGNGRRARRERYRNGLSF